MLNKDVSFIQELWKKLTRNGQIKAIFAGGCLRDTLLERPVKDYDLFIEYDDWYNAMVVLSQEFPGNIGLKHCTNEAMGAYGSGEARIAEVDSRLLLGDYIVDFIRLPENYPLDKVVEEFDTGISKVSFDGKLRITPEFYKDVAEKTITVYRVNGTGDRLVNRLSRLEEKYPEFRVGAGNRVADMELPSTYRKPAEEDIYSNIGF